jgi:F-type H+-transporting ATPase subunit b
MPQLDFAHYLFASQLFWLFSSFLFLYFLVKIIILPRFNAIFTNREKVINDAIAKAEEIKTQSFEIVGDHEEILKSARVETEAKIAEVTKLVRAEDAAAHLETDKEIAQKLNNLQQRAAKFTDSSHDKIANIAIEIASLIAQKIGVNADKKIFEKIISKNIQ